MARIRRLNPLELQLAETHARRGDKRSQARVVRDEPPVTWLPAGVETDPLSLPQLYSDHVEGAFIPKGKAKALHLLVKFPESVPVESTADAEAALKLAVDFAQSIFGGDAVFAARMDRDEKSLTNADLFIAPRYVKRTKHSEKVAVSLTRHMKMMAERRLGHLPQDKDILRAQGQALQDEFAEFLRARGYQAMRGQKKGTKEPDWISPEAYGVSTDRKIAEAHRELADEEFKQAANERAIAARDRADIEGRLASKEQELHERAAILAEAEEEALARRKQAEAEAEQMIARALREAQVIRDRAHAEAENGKAAAAETLREARALSDRTKAAATAAMEREQQITVAEDAIRVANEEIARAERQARNNLEDADRRLVEAETAEAKAADIIAAVTEARADADISSRQLALIGRALDDERLALSVDNGPRGVSMNENAMSDGEREAYRARWSDLVRSIARSAAAALAKAREIMSAAVGKANEKLAEVTNEIVRRRKDLDNESAVVNAAKIELGRERRQLGQVIDVARAFVESWEKIPAEQRAPKITATADRARGLISQAELLSPSGETVSGIGTSEADEPAPGFRSRDGVSR